MLTDTITKKEDSTPTQRYKVYFQRQGNKGHNGSDEKKRPLHSSSKTGCEKKGKCVLLVSIHDQKYCSGPYFPILLQEARKKFKHVSILIVDGPHQHTIKAKLAPNTDQEQTPQELAAQEGEKWFTENSEAFYHLLPPPSNKKPCKSTIQQKIADINAQAENNDALFKIYTWESWIEGSNLPAIEEVPDTLKQALLPAAKKYVQRHLYATTAAASLDFLLEEALGLYSRCIDLGIENIVYPGPLIEGFNKVQEFASNRDNTHTNSNSQDIAWIAWHLAKFRSLKKPSVSPVLELPGSPTSPVTPKRPTSPIIPEHPELIPELKPPMTNPLLLFHPSDDDTDDTSSGNKLPCPPASFLHNYHPTLS